MGPVARFRFRLCSTLLLVASACSEVHSRTDELDAFVATDEGIAIDEGVLEVDLGMDAGVQDAGPVAVIELTGQFATLIGARDFRVFDDDSINTWLVAGSDDADVNAVLIEPAFLDDEIDFSRTFEIANTLRLLPVAAARDRDQVAVLFGRLADFPLLVIVDGRTGETLNSQSLTFLAEGLPLSADLALRDGHVTVVTNVLAPQLSVNTLIVSGAGFAVQAHYDLTDHYTSATTPDADGAGAVVAAVSTMHILTTFHVTDGELIALEGVSRDGVLPAWDQATLAYLGGETWIVGGWDYPLHPTWDSINGEPSLAREGESSFALAFTSNSGSAFLAVSTRVGDDATWYEITPRAFTPTAFASHPIAHADEAHLGAFYLEGSPVGELPVVRYFAAAL